LTTITQSEWDDLYQTLAKYKRTRKEFDFDEKVSKLIHTGVNPELGKLTIRLSATDEAKTYNTGHGSAWVVEFDDDLKAGPFKR
jgi:hypothetical protein